MKRADFFRKIATAVIALLLCQPAVFGQNLPPHSRLAGRDEPANRIVS